MILKIKNERLNSCSRTSVSIALTISFLIFNISFSTAQSGIKSDDLQRLHLMQDTLKHLSDSLVLSKNPKVRLQSSQLFIRTLVRALKVEGSYSYPFDSLKRIVKLEAPDKKFRLFNWGTMLDD